MNYKKTFIQLGILVFFLLLAYLISHKSRKGDYLSVVGFTQGTTYRITYESKKGEQLQVAIDSLLAEFDKSLSTYQSNSIISQVQ